ncbi:conserved hypothetical protein [Cupriavidus taiwanensis]|uniref:YfbU family protein n=1 Tax=Cupriavidus taiwanensis TaxID=164546 RepID=UPI000E1597D4|nr:YfbU family protein [Cupriavidus taiwanensis]SPA23773.1 conserved hypothetical protein [Cupriavidus taiwanensis]
MPPKTERFEMRMDEEVLDRIDSWRSEQDDLPSRAEAVRRLVEIALAKQPEREVTISDGEKLLLTMMGDLYKALGVKTPEVDPAFIGGVLSGGHYWALDWELQGLFHGHRDRRETVQFVVDVLDMWDFLESAFAKLSPEEKERVAIEAEPFGKHVEFAGFDGNNEGEYMGIARFMIEEMGRFSKFKGRALNSHYPSVATYARMYQVFEPIRKTLIGHGLSGDQIIAILKARQHA